MNARHPSLISKGRFALAGEHGNKWKDTKVFTTYREMLEDSSAKPTAAFIGLPPMYHGALEDPNANIEVLRHVFS